MYYSIENSFKYHFIYYHRISKAEAIQLNQQTFEMNRTEDSKMTIFCTVSSFGKIFHQMRIKNRNNKRISVAVLNFYTPTVNRCLHFVPDWS